MWSVDHGVQQQQQQQRAMHMHSMNGFMYGAQAMMPVVTALPPVVLRHSPASSSTSSSSRSQSPSGTESWQHGVDHLTDASASSSPGQYTPPPTNDVSSAADEWSMLSDLFDNVHGGSGSAAVSTPVAQQPLQVQPSTWPLPAKTMDSLNIKEEPAAAALSLEEQKKIRRRGQIASSVQRHREKKRKMVASLKDELTTLTAQLTLLRSQRKGLHPDGKLVEYEEMAVMQRRKRRQSEEMNSQIKRALFEQSAFLSGFRKMIMNQMPGPKELEFHQWIHSYTVLAGTDPLSRRREYLAAFSDSKMELAQNIVMRETDQIAWKLSRAKPYYASARVLVDASRLDGMCDDYASVVKNEQVVMPDGTDGNEGLLTKKFTAMFLFEENEHVNFDSFYQVALEATKGVGVFWPSEGYDGRLQEIVDLNDSAEDESAGKTDDKSRVYYTDLHAELSMGSGDDALPVTIESRMLCREQKTDTTGLIVWDYVDKDALHPHDEHVTNDDFLVRRDGCGSIVLQRERNGLVSLRSVSVKRFSPFVRENDPAGSELRKYQQMNKHAGDMEARQQRCTCWVYDAICNSLMEATDMLSRSHSECGECSKKFSLLSKKRKCKHCMTPLCKNCVDAHTQSKHPSVASAQAARRELVAGSRAAVTAWTKKEMEIKKQQRLAKRNSCYAMTPIPNVHSTRQHQHREIFTMRQEPDENEATGTCASDRNSASDPHFLPVNAAKLTQSLIGLSDEQRQVLEKELNRTDEDPLLVLRFNPNWQGQVAVGTVCDAIATFGMRGGARRDSGEGCHGWVFHFDHYQDLGPCKTAIALAHPEAFAFSPRAITRAEAAFGAAARANLPTEPLAYAVVINKIAIRQDDAGSLEFFYL
ncbi:TPA: hypothetical protein N0F65_012411 [Lagenidium giganteum]|uniref:FYVE-type domain-containing protein n=1 Tax=Lagenidium giganteum TaxID=4803 RepID=A0AAV2YCD7_9STRA|nr:TPA: hypothetical protein N0F65_012411 [Lagenidium giganteum]